MKKSKITPLDAGHNRKVLIDEQDCTDQSPIELICNSCHTNTLVTITDGAGNSDLFCKRCGVTYDTEDDTIRHRQRLLPPDDPEPAATSIQYDFTKDVEIRHQPTLKDGAAQLAKRGTIKFTYYYDSSEH